MINENDYLIIVKKEYGDVIKNILANFIDTEDNLIFIERDIYSIFIICGELSKFNTILKNELNKLNIPFYFRSNYTILGKEDYYEDLKNFIEMFDIDFLRKSECSRQKKAYKDIKINQAF